MPMWRQSLIVMGYLCYAVALFALFAYLNFPSQQVRAFVLATLSYYGLERIHVGSVRPLLPAGLTFSEVHVAQEVSGQAVELVRMPELQLQLRTFHSLGKVARVDFEGALYGGRLLGVLEWEHNGKGPMLDIRVDLQDIRPAAHPLAARLGNSMMEGKLTGSMTFQLSGGRWQDGDGHLTIRSDVGRIAGLEIGGIQLPSLTYEQLAGELMLQQRSIVVKDFQIRGHDWQVDLQGKVSLNDRLPQSPIDLTLHVRAAEGLEQQLGLLGMLLKQRRDRRGFTSLRIGGTLEHPNPVL